METTETATSPPWIDKKLLELWLRAYYGEITVTDVELEPSTLKGDNYLSRINHLVVRTKEGGAHALIVKVCMEEGVAAEIMKDSSIFKKEKAMYNNILPKIHSILQEIMPDGFEPLFPRCFYACRAFLVMENLTAAGFKMADRLVGLDLQPSLLVMRTIARFHAASVILHQRDPDSMRKFLISFFHEPSSEYNFTKFASGMANTLVEELDTWSEEWKKYADVLRRQAPDVIKLVQQTIERRESGFNVLIHGDVWTNNILFTEDRKRTRILDFQLAYLGSPVIDIYYFIVTSATPEVRINHMDRLLQEYHSTLCETLTALGYTQTLMSLEELHKEFDSKSYYGLFTMICPYAVMQCPPDCGFNFDEALDNGKNPGPVMYGDQYKKSVKWLLPFFESKGLFEGK
ncbi:uncharacterized protein [Periplaneta americana]|uniref:uncharacterized protein n=1 Tax=Periplaneta americana TaxID=6978 RepID=UPI0037E91E60